MKFFVISTAAFAAAMIAFSPIALAEHDLDQKKINKCMKDDACRSGLRKTIQSYIDERKLEHRKERLTERRHHHKAEQLPEKEQRKPEIKVRPTEPAENPSQEIKPGQPY